MMKKFNITDSPYTRIATAIMLACASMVAVAQESQSTGAVYGHRITTEGTPEIEYAAGKVRATLLPTATDPDSTDIHADWRYVWKVDGEPAVEGGAGGIELAVIPSFDIPQQDFNKPAMLCLYALASSGYPEETRESAEVCSAPLLLTNTAPVANNVGVAGRSLLGQTLTAEYVYADAEGDSEGTTTVQWYRANNAAGTNKVAITQATNKEYVAVAADLSKYLAVEVTPVAATGLLTGAVTQSDYLGPILVDIANWSPPAGATMTWSEADTYCGNLSVKGFTDWRLPTRDELVALYSSYPNNILRLEYGWPTNGNWSSTLYNTGRHYTVRLSDGNVDSFNDGGGFYVACVR